MQFLLLQFLHHITKHHVRDNLFLLSAVTDITSSISCSYLVQNKQHMALGTGQSQVFGHPPECWHTVVCPRPTKCVSCQFTDGASDILITQHVSTLHQTLYTQNKLLKCGSLHGIQNNTINNKPTKHSTRNLKCNNRNLDLLQKSNERKESLNLIVNVWSGYINVASISQGLHTHLHYM